ncbi:MAG: hypothetical protein R6W31_10255 [Bacteroidales bacterium]
MKGLKHISVLLLVNMFILIGHHLVPHHHHVAFVNHPSTNECPTTDPAHHNKDSGSKHCHAFNDIHFVKYNHLQVLRPVIQASFVVIGDPGNVPDPVTGLATAPRLPLHPPIDSPIFSGKHSLRGPPHS